MSVISAESCIIVQFSFDISHIGPKACLNMTEDPPYCAILKTDK